MSLHAAVVENFESNEVFVRYHTLLLATLKVRLVPGARHVIQSASLPVLATSSTRCTCARHVIHPPQVGGPASEEVEEL